MVKIYKQPFAHSGDTIAIPDASQPDGKMSSTDGWTPDYQLPKINPNYKPVGRQEMNGVFKEVTEALGEMQQFGFAAWQLVGGGWPAGANVNHGGGVWQSLASANTEEPGTGVLWKPILFDNIEQSTEASLGLIGIATTAEARALANDANAMTPAKLAAAFGGANQSIATNGYQKLPGGLIIQWGGGTPNGSGNYQTTLPIAFPTSHARALATTQGESNPALCISVFTLNTTSIDVRVRTLGGAASTQGIAWIAFGY